MFDELGALGRGATQESEDAPLFMRFDLEGFTEWQKDTEVRWAAFRRAERGSW